MDDFEKAIVQSDGRLDFVLGRFYNAEKRNAEKQALYTKGWKDAHEDEKKKGKVVFLLDELHDILNATDEVYFAEDFEMLLTIIKRIKDAYEQEKNPTL